MGAFPVETRLERKQLGTGLYARAQVPFEVVKIFVMGAAK
jgi:hypothetical protein